VGDGKNILFWLDTWLSEYSLATLFWDLFAIRNEPSATVADVLVDHEIYLTFRQCINDLVMERRYEVRNFLLSISLSGGKGQPYCLEASRTYTLSSFYQRVKDGGVWVPYLAAIWSIQIHGRVHILLWLLSQNRLLTRDNLAKRFL
jgi:hypothetical protein